MHPNGPAPPAAPPRPTSDPDPAAGDLFMELDEEGQAALNDEVWIGEQYNLGGFDAYRGEYIAVVGKKVLGHSKNLFKLREDVTAATGIPASRIVTTLIVRKMDL